MSECTMQLLGGLMLGLGCLQHGSRSSSSACGSADVLETLGVAVDLGPEVCKCCGFHVFYPFPYKIIEISSL